MPNATNNPSWGKPGIYVKNLDDASPAWAKIPTPVEDSTQLVPTAGDSIDATVEGGEVEASRKKASSYELSYAIRYLAGRAMPMEHTNGVVSGHYAVALIPEDPTAPGFCIQNSTVGAEDPFNCADGSNWTYRHKVLKPASGKMVKWGTITATESQGAISITGQGCDFGETAVTL